MWEGRRPEDRDQRPTEAQRRWVAAATKGQMTEVRGADDKRSKTTN
jgi:hypothetical protein